MVLVAADVSLPELLPNENADVGFAPEDESPGRCACFDCGVVD